MTQPSESPGAATSMHVHRAKNGDSESLAWVVGRFSPLLMAQAMYRLGKQLRSLYDPEDLVQEVWAVTLPKLEILGSAEGRETPVLLRFLSTTLALRVRGLVRKHIQGKRVLREGDIPRDREEEGNLFSRLSAETTGVITRAIRIEQRGEVLSSLETLDDLDREILILRGVEQNENETVATLLGVQPNTVSQRYRRALKKLRDRLPGSIFSEFQED